MRYILPAPTIMHELKVDSWQLVYAIEAADGAFVREYQAKSPVPDRMYQKRIREDASGSYGSYSVTR